VTFTASVSPSGATGTVTFKEGSTTLGTGTITSGKATFATSALAVGSHSISASYAGDSNYNGSTSTTLTQTVNKANTSVSLTSSANPSGLGSPVTFTATVTPSAATGTVTFKDGSTTVGTGTVSSGVATFTTSTLAIGSHSITAAYGGDSNYNSSTSTTLTQTVKQASSVALSSSANPSALGSSVTFTATVTPSSATGTVTFKDSTTTLGTGTLSGGKATYTTASLSGGSHSITAVYGGNSTYAGSTSSVLTQIVLTVVGLSVAPANVPLPLNSKQQYIATATYSDNSTHDVTASATWSVSNTSIATISAAGLLTAVMEGQTTVQAAYGSLNNTTNLTVTGPTFIQVGALATGEGYYSTATLLPNGKVLIVGAYGGLSSAKLYDPATGTFSPTGSLWTGRGWHTATLLDNGRVLIAGGLDASYHSVRTAELYDADAGTFSFAGYMNGNGRYAHTATLLKNGQVLLAGGDFLTSGGGGPAPAELYDPVAATFTLTGDLSVPRADGTATMLNDGTVLVIGGYDQSSYSSPAVERYNIATGTFTRIADLGTPRGDLTATLLGTGKVLVVGGGCTSCSPATLASAELYDPTTGLFSPTGRLTLDREFHTATLLSDGTVLIVGGSGTTGTIGTAELYNPANQNFTGAGALINGRYGALATLLHDGTVLVAGGAGLTGDEIAELYAPTPPPPSSLQITPSSVNMVVGDTHQFTAIDNNGHRRSDAIWSLSDDSLATITTDSSPTLTAIAAGNLTLTAYVQGRFAQAQITIFPTETVLNPGTPVWSLPSTPGFMPLQIAQAIPNDLGPDLYSAETSADGKTTLLHGLTADGRQIWQTQLPALTNKSVPDASGGLMVTEHATCDQNQTDPMTVADIDPTTGQELWRIRAGGVQYGQQIIYCYSPDVAPQIAVRPDGWVLMSSPTNAGMPPLIQVWHGAAYNVSIPDSSFTDSSGVVHTVQSMVGPPMVDADGSTYVEYQVRDLGQTKVNSASLYLLKMTFDFWTPTTTLLMSNTDLNSGRFPESTDSSLLPGRVIPDGQGGVIATWTISPSNLPFPPQLWHYYQAAHVVGGSVVANYDLPFTPLNPVLNKYPTLALGEYGTAFASGLSAANDGSPVDRQQIVSFDISTGTPKWTYQAAGTENLTILAATSDGGVAVSDSRNGFTHFDASGQSSLVPGTVGTSGQYSWTNRWAAQSSAGASQLALPLDVDTASTWATPNGNASQTGAAIPLCPCEEQFDQGTNSPTSGEQFPSAASSEAISSVSVPSPEGATYTYLQLIGDQGINGPGCPQDPTHCHNTGQRFSLAAQTEADNLTQSGSNVVIPYRVSSVQNVETALTTSGPITGMVTYFGHGGYLPQLDGSYLSILAVGQAPGADTNVAAYNVNTLSNAQLSTDTSLVLKTCRAGLAPAGGHSIAQLLANQLNRGVYAWKVGAFFSHSSSATLPQGMPSETKPMYLLPMGGNTVAPCLFKPNQPEPQHCGGEQ